MLGKPIREMTFPEKLGRTYEILEEEETTRGYAARVAVIMEKLAQRQLTCAVIGQFKRGKSALVNEMLGAEILPVGIVPITSAVTRVEYGSDTGAQIRYRNGVVEEVEYSELSRYISEQENSDNRLGIAEAVIRTDAGFLADGLTLVDTPGVGSFHKGNTETAYDNVKESDAVIFLLSVDSPINEIEIDFLKRARKFAARFYFAVNKIDLIPEDDLRAYLDYCESVLTQIMAGGQDGGDDAYSADLGTEDGTGADRPNIRIFPVSAKTGRGVEELKKRVLADLSANSGTIAEASARKKLKDLVVRAIGQLNFYWKAMNMPFDELDERFAAITEEIEDIRSDAECVIRDGGKTDQNLAARLNDYKLRLSDKVSRLFCMEYHYDIGLLEDEPDFSVDEQNVPDPAGRGNRKMTSEDFRVSAEELMEEFRNTLTGILLYREENAYVVCHRINSINRATRELRRVRDSLED